MNAVSLFAFIVAIFFGALVSVCSHLPLYAQNRPSPQVRNTPEIPLPSVFMPETLAMRPFDYLSGAGAVAWNPAMLGVRNHLDIALLSEFSSFAPPTREVYGNFGFFAKFSGIAIGDAKNLAMRSSSGELYLGGGFPIVDNIVWGGASGRLSMEEPRARFDFAASLLARPLPYLIVGATATTISRI